MKKVLTRVVALGSALFMALSSGCANAPLGGGGSYELWTTYNTLKVVQDPELNGNYEKMPVAINVAMSQNESEMGSFYVTTVDKEINSFDLKVNDLTNADGDVLPTSQMEVYAQKYVNVTSKSQGNTLEAYPLGWMPDPLVPLQLYKNEEEDKIGKNKNQGFSVDFTTTAQTPAGIYTGTFELKLDDKTENIPVKVEVWDFALPEKSAAQSCVLIYERQVMQSEGFSTDTEEFDQWYIKYYEQALEYKMNPYMVPYSLDGAEAFIASVKKYWNHPNFATYGMPHQTFISGDEAVYMEYYRDCLYKFAVESAKDKIDYLALTYFYPIDEPEDNEALRRTIKWIEDLRAFFLEVQAQVENDGVFAQYGCSPEFTAQCKESLENIEIVITAGGDEPVLQEYDFTYCPTVNHWGDTMAAENLYAHAEEFNTSLWYYTHIRPNWPAPTVHIDDYWLSTRIMKWMQKYNNLDAYLYYDYCSALTGSVYKQDYHGDNRYEVVNKSPGLSANGDGFFVYPAAKYEADEPIISMRLLAYRDGQDDLDMLNYLDSFYTEYEKYYGVETGTMDVNNVISALYDRIFCNTNVISDDSLAFDKIRNSVKDLVLNAKKQDGNKFVYLIDYDGNYANYSFYTAPGYQVKVNGQVLSSTESGQGLKHTYSMNFASTSLLTSVEVVKDNQSEVMELFESIDMRGIDVTASDFDVTVSEGSTKTVNTDNKSLDFVVKSKDYGVGKEALTLLFIPCIEFNSIGNFSVLEYFCENKTNENTEMTMTIVAYDGTTLTSDVGLPANSSRLIKCQNRLRGKQIVSISIEFENIYSSGDELIPLNDRTISISNMRVR